MTKANEIIENIRKKVKKETENFKTGAKINFDGGDVPNTHYGKQKKLYEYNLLCPHCNGNNMHQHTVGIYNRDEDATKGTHVEVTKDKVTIDSKLDGNPSLRRQGLSIAFWCEHCDGEYIFNIYQHKGLTLMGWENE